MLADLDSLSNHLLRAVRRHQNMLVSYYYKISTP